VSQDDPLDYGDPTSAANPTTVDGITAVVSTPSTSSTQVVTLTLSASSDDGPVTGDVVVGDTTRALHGDGTLTADIGLASGANVLSIRLATADGKHYRRISHTIGYAGDGVQITRVTAAHEGTCDDATLGSVVAAAQVCVFTSAPATLSGGAAIDGDVVTLSDGDNTITATAGSAHDTLTVVHDAAGPTLSIDHVAPTAASEVMLHGTVTDPAGVMSLAVQDPTGTLDEVPIESPFDIPIGLQPGLNSVTVVATDRAGNITRVDVTVRRARTFHLADSTPPGSPLTLSLDRAALGELVLEPDQKALVLANVDLRPAMVNAFNAVKDPVKYGVDTSHWTQLQWNSHNILNITPDNIDVTGTLMEPLLRVSEAVGVAPARILAETFGIAPTDSILAGEQIVDSLIDNVVGSHPNAQFDAETGRPVFVLTLYDVLHDLETLGERLGPVPGHPGLVGPGGTHGDLLEAGFAMNVTATSNFRRYDGIDASRDAKDFFFSLEPNTPAVAFDFNNPDTFTVVGMKDQPTLDFQFQITGILEHIDPGTEQLVNPAPADKFGEGFFFGNSQAWSIDRYFDERVITESAFRIYHAQFADTGYHYTHVYDAGNIDAVATVTWDRGWLDIQTKGNLGSPPAPAYIWDMVLDVVQERALDGGLEPFGGSTIFDMHAIPVGLDADQLIAELRPTLQGQATKMSDILVGREQLASSGADFYFTPGFLVFRAATDSSTPFTYTHPGFFADESLTTKVSTVSDGHERAPMTAGASYFMADDTGAVFHITIIDDHTIEVLPTTTEAP